MLELAKRFERLFAGSESAHGEFIIQDKKGAKAVGKAATISTPADTALWEDHLLGNKGIGIIPIRKNNTCSWGAVDIDVYEGFDLEEFSKKLPDSVTLLRSKSGGAHVYIFCDPPAPATLVRKKLAVIARAVGHSNAELFPKQERLDSGVGNWINSPYFHSELTTRYCLHNGLSLNAEEFLDLAESRILTLEQLVAFDMSSIEEVEDDGEFADAPPCLQYLTKHGFPKGTLNNALFSMGVYAKKKFQNNWKDKVGEYNLRFMGPGTYTEVAAIIRSLDKKSYLYKCNDIPLCNYCDKHTCSEMPFGIDLSDRDEKNKRPCILDDISSVTCYIPPQNSKDDPYWIFEFDGKELNVTVDMARNQGLFYREYIRVFRRVPLAVKDVKWNKSINLLLEKADIVEQAPDAGAEGQLWLHIESFTNGKAQAKSRDELLNGRPWRDGLRVYFRSNDLMKHLDQNRFRYFGESEIASILRRRSMKHHTITVKGKSLYCWSIEAFDNQQTEEFDSEFIEHEETY